MPNVSIVLPTYNRLQQLKLVLDALEKQSYPHDQFEVIVVSDGSTDGTNAYLQSVQKPFDLIPVFQENQGVAATRNHGIQHAKGELILFLDDDVVPNANLIVEHLRFHEKLGENVVVIGPMLTPTNFSLSPWVRWSQERLGEQYRAMITGVWETTARQFYTGNTSLNRNILLKHGGFDPQFRRAEDVELAYRLHAHGIRFFFCPDAIGYHYEQRSFQSWLDIPYAYGRNDVIFTYEKGNTWLLPWIFREFHNRNPVTRGLVKICLNHPKRKKLITKNLEQIVRFSESLHLPVLSRIACSTLFNLSYYQGIADELGDSRLFLDNVRRKRLPPPM